jgi:hypothetical protein
MAWKYDNLIFFYRIIYFVLNEKKRKEIDLDFKRIKAK